MLIPRFVPWMLSVSMMVLCPNVASGQNYPNKVIRIATAQAGSGNDLVSRLIAHGLTGSLGQQVIVENRGRMAIEIAVKAPPDGYTLLLYTSVVWLEPFLRSNVPWDPVSDFSPITLPAESPSILVVHPSLPVKSVKDLIALAKARPGELNYGSTSTGAAPHLAAELFKAMAGVDIVRISYKGGASGSTALIAGEVQLTFSSTGTVMLHGKSGRLRALAVTTAQPSALVPGLPTVAAAGLPGFEAGTIYGMFAPVKTPATIINRLNEEVVRVLNRADVKERLFNAGVQVVGSSPEKFTATMKSEMAKWGKVIKDANIHE